MVAIWFVLLCICFINTNVVRANYTTRIYSNLAEIIYPVNRLPLEFNIDDWNHIRPDSITLLGDDLDVTSRTITEQKKSWSHAEVYIHLPTSFDHKSSKLIKGTLIDELNSIVKIQYETADGPKTLFVTVPHNDIIYLEEPTKPKYYVNFTYTSSPDSSVFVSYLQSNLNWHSQYQLNLYENKQHELIAMANIRNEAKSSISLGQTELIGGDINLQMHSSQHDRLFRKYRSNVEPLIRLQNYALQSSFTEATDSTFISQGKELYGLYVFHIDKPLTINSRTSILLPMFRPKVSIERYAFISNIFSTESKMGRAQRSYCLKSSQYLSPGSCIIREYDRIVGETSLPSLAADEKHEFSLGEDADIVYKENVTLISSTALNTTEVKEQFRLEKSIPTAGNTLHTRLHYKIYLEIKNHKSRSINIKYEQQGFHLYQHVKLLEADQHPFIQDGISIKCNMTLKENTTEYYSYGVELLR